MDLGVKGKLLRNIALVGLVLLLAGSLLLPGSHALYVAIPAFALIAIGAFGLLALSTKDRLRPVPARIGSSTPAFPSLANAPVTAESPSSGSPDLTRAVRFDLVREFQERRAQMRFWVVFCLGAAVLFLALGAIEIGIGTAGARVTPFSLGVLLLAMCVFMFSRFRRAYRGVAEISVGPDGISFRQVPPAPVILRWEDSAFGLRLTETSADVNHAADPAKTRPTYWLSAGSSTLAKSGTQVFTDIPPACFELLLRQARAHRLDVVVGAAGVAGTASERRTYRIGHGLVRFPAGNP